MTRFEKELKKILNQHQGKAGVLVKLNEIQSAIAESSDDSRPNLHFTITAFAKFIEQVPDDYLE